MTFGGRRSCATRPRRLRCQMNGERRCSNLAGELFDRGISGDLGSKLTSSNLGLDQRPVVQVFRQIPNRIRVLIVGHVVQLKLLKASRFPASLAGRDAHVALYFLLTLSKLAVPLQQFLRLNDDEVVVPLGEA